jgi:nucleotide-binding universal stress UspA family protein
MFKKILVAIDGSEQSMKGVDVAISMAKMYGSELTALHVVIFQFNESNHPSPEWLQEFNESVRRQTDQWFSIITERGKNNNIKVDTKYIETPRSIPYGIARFADERKVDLIVVGSKGRSSIEKLYLGSVASGVLTYASCMVLVVR